jgi:hypothetical protein
VPVVALDVLGVPADNVYALGVLRPLPVTTIGPDGLPLVDRVVRWTSSKPMIATASDGGVFGLLTGAGALRVESEGVAMNLPFEIREGVAVPSGGPPATATVLGGKLTLTVPSGVAPAGTAIHARLAESWPADDRLVAATQIEVGPASAELALPITAGITFDPLAIPAGERAALRIFAVNISGVWAELPGGTVDLGNFRVSANLTRLTKLAIIRRSTPVDLLKVAGDNQFVNRNDPVPVAPSVLVRDGQNRPVSGIIVSFAPAGGGMITGQSTATSNALGVATLSGTWRVGSSAGTYSLVASITGGISTTFTVTALP